jgi:putative flippase GtrA
MIKKFINKSFLYFIIIGIINTINHSLIYLLMLLFTNYIISNLIAFIISMSISYILNSKITFKVKISFKNYLKFPITYLPNIILQFLGLIILVETLNVKEIYAAFLASLIAIPITFITMRYILKG